MVVKHCRVAKEDKKAQLEKFSVVVVERDREKGFSCVSETERKKKKEERERERWWAQEDQIGLGAKKQLG